MGKQNKEQDILLAAEEEFLTKGYDGALTRIQMGVKKYFASENN